MVAYLAVSLLAQPPRESIDFLSKICYNIFYHLILQDSLVVMTLRRFRRIDSSCAGTTRPQPSSPRMTTVACWLVSHWSTGSSCSPLPACLRTSRGITVPASTGRRSSAGSTPQWCGAPSRSEFRSPTAHSSTRVRTVCSGPSSTSWLPGLPCWTSSDQMPGWSTRRWSASVGLSPRHGDHPLPS